MKTQLTWWVMAWVSACGPRVPVGTLGSEDDGTAGSKSGSVLPGDEDGDSVAAGGTGPARPKDANVPNPTVDAGAAGSGETSTAGGASNEPEPGPEPEPDPLGAYQPRSGSFKMLVYSATKGFRHQDGIQAGKLLLAQIADEQGFELETTEENDFLTHIDDYEVLFFLNPTGDIFTDAEQAVFEAWMTTGHGAFVGVHSATDTENGWPFYSEVTGEYYDGHGPYGTEAHLQLEPTALAHPALAGLPNPWARIDEWPRFNDHAIWSQKPGFQILARNPTDGHPVSWVRQFAGFRSFYTAIGHGSQSYADAQIKQHLTGGIMWAVRREHLLD